MVSKCWYFETVSEYPAGGDAAQAALQKILHELTKQCESYAFGQNATTLRIAGHFTTRVTVGEHTARGCIPMQLSVLQERSCYSEARDRANVAQDSLESFIMTKHEKERAEAELTLKALRERRKTCLWKRQLERGDPPNPPLQTQHGREGGARGRYPTRGIKTEHKKPVQVIESSSSESETESTEESESSSYSGSDELLSSVDNESPRKDAVQLAQEWLRKNTLLKERMAKPPFEPPRKPEQQEESLDLDKLGEESTSESSSDQPEDYYHPPKGDMGEKPPNVGEQPPQSPTLQAWRSKLRKRRTLKKQQKAALVRKVVHELQRKKK